MGWWSRCKGLRGKLELIERSVVQALTGKILQEVTISITDPWEEGSELHNGGFYILSLV